MLIARRAQIEPIRFALSRVYWAEYMSIASTVAVTRSLATSFGVFDVSLFVLILELHKLVFTFVNAIYDYLICVYDVFIIFPKEIKIRANCDAYQHDWLMPVPALSCGFLRNYRAQQSSSNIEQIPAIRNPAPA